MPSTAPSQPPPPPAPAWLEIGRPSPGEAQDWATWVAPLGRGGGGDALDGIQLLTGDGAHDAAEVPALLDQVEGGIASVTADGAYDGEPVYQAVAGRQPNPPPDVVVPPRALAAASTKDADTQGQRDRHIRLITERGCVAWQKATGYGRRSHAEMVCSQSTNSA